MPDARSVPPALQEFVEDGLIDGVAFRLKSGKEATLYVCERAAGHGSRLCAAKVYRDLNHRSFRRDEVYREGRWIGDHRLRRAVRKKTRCGQEFAFGLWVHEEADMLRRAREGGAEVPRVIAASGPVILMEYFGDPEGPAPMLCELDLSRAEAPRVFEEVLSNVERLLRADVVHADLSAFNVLYWEGRVVVIDFPQAVDARLNPHARDLLARDLGNVCDFFRRLNVNADAAALAGELWDRYQWARL